MILVTGYRGFVGSHLVKRLDDWVGFDLKDGMDLADLDSVKQFIKKYKPDKVIHLASESVAKYCDDNPDIAFRNIAQATFNLLEAVKDVERFVYISSSMVYGDFYKDNNNEILPAIERQNCRPKGVYGKLKLVCEEMVKTSGLPFVIIRPSAVYGYGDTNNRVVQLFLERAMKGLPLTLDNGGLHQLDFTYVDDLVEGLVLALEEDRAVYETFNMTYGQGRTIKELANIIKDILPKTKIVDKKADVFRPNRGTLDCVWAISILGYRPKYKLEQGLRRYYENKIAE